MPIRRIDIASFECPDCGHCSTPPESINSIPDQMETYNTIDATHIPDKDTEDIFIQTLEQYHYGNDFIIHAQRKPTPELPPLLVSEVEPSAYEKVIKVQRSYCNVKEQSSTILSESNHIVLSCPQCGAQLYEVSWRA